MIRIWVEKGKAWAQATLGNLYETGRGVKQSYKKALKLFRAAVKKNDPTAMYKLGNMYEKGHGVEQSYERAVEYHSMAVDYGHRGAQFNLGVLYLHGQGVAQSDDKAFELYTLAAELGEVNAQCNLGGMYAQGRGVVQSFVLAREWWEKCAAQGDEDCINNLKILDAEEGKTFSCATCNAPATSSHTLMSCTCLSVWYCNKACQRQSWGTHRAEHRRVCAEQGVSRVGGEGKDEVVEASAEQEESAATTAESPFGSPGETPEEFSMDDILGFFFYWVLMFSICRMFLYCKKKCRMKCGGGRETKNVKRNGVKKSRARKTRRGKGRRRM